MSVIDVPNASSGHFVRHDPIAPSPPPLLTKGPVAWVMANLFSSVGNTAMTLLGLLFAAWVIPPILNFVFFHAVFVGTDREACLVDKVGGPVGACWTFVTTRIGYFMYGQYPVDERWRVDLVWVLGALGIVWLLWPRIGAKVWAALYFFIAFPVVAIVLLAGGSLSYALIGSALTAVSWLLAGIGILLGGLGYALGGLLELILFFVPGIAAADTIASIGWPFRALADLIGWLRDLATTNLGVAGFWLDFVLSAAAVLLIAASLLRQSSTRSRSLLIALAVVVGIALFVRWAGLDTGLQPVSTNLWGGLLVTLVISSVGIVVSLPLGILLALGRRSKLPIVTGFSTIFIEFVRGVPLITVLFMANVMLPLFLPPGWRPDSLLRVLMGVALFASAYMAEVVRGGLQAMPKGQYEGAMAMGLNYPQMMILVILPQALKLVIPGIVNTFIGLFKDTSLVAIVGIFDLMKTIEASNSDPKWATPVTGYTGYLFAAIVYFVFCFGMSRYSLSVERRLDTGHKR